MQYQAAFQLAQTAPEMYDMQELHRQMLEVLGIQDVDNIVPDSDDVLPVDPVTAVQNLINNKPVKAYDFQDHDAHIQTVASAQENPEIISLVEKSPNAPSILASASAYINEHLTMKYRQQVEEELGIELPPMGEPIAPEIEARIGKLVAEASMRVTEKARMDAEQERINQQQQDPIIQAKLQEVATKQAEVQRKANADAARLQLAAEKQRTQAELEREKLQVEVASTLLEEERKSNKQAAEDFKTGIDIAKEVMDDVNTNEQ